MKVVMLLLWSILIVGCKEQSFSEEDEQMIAHLRKVADGTRVFDGDPEPKYPENPDETLQGVDADNDGVRDDVEIWINENFKTANERRAWKQETSALMEGYKYLNSAEEYTAAFNRLGLRSYRCGFYIYLFEPDDYGPVDKKLRVQLFNTYPRLEMMNKGLRLYRGDKNEPKIELDDYYKFCNFKIENFEDLQKKVNKRFYGEKVK